MKIGNLGQTLAEFALLTLVMVLVVAIVATLFSEHWQRAKCAYLVFEKTHARLVGRREANPSVRIDLHETSVSVKGIGYCEKWIEKVELPKLEAAQW